MYIRITITNSVSKSFMIETNYHRIDFKELRTNSSKIIPGSYDKFMSIKLIVLDRIYHKSANRLIIPEGSEKNDKTLHHKLD